jgi:hypothetical protein
MSNRAILLHLLALAILAGLALLLSGCTWSRTTTATVERTTGTHAGQPTDLTTTRREIASTEAGPELGTLVQAAVSAGLGDVRGAITALRDRPSAPSVDEIAKALPAPEPQPKILGLTTAELMALAASLWGVERGVSATIKRRQQRKAAQQ